MLEAKFIITGFIVPLWCDWLPKKTLVHTTVMRVFKLHITLCSKYVYQIAFYMLVFDVEIAKALQCCKICSVLTNNIYS